MTKHAALVEVFPKFAEELRLALAACGEPHLAAQVLDLTVASCSYDSSGEAGYIRVRSAETLNVVEQNIIGTRHGRTVSVDHPCWVYVDVDNFDRITGIELLAASPHAAQLLAFGVTPSSFDDV
ncbi:DUF2283 domain-containing protein [Roseateles sp.]|uniref:DUF2283 domain-containing protein n=1 Tax=Roseateles sp. TaxID=1971397 RepID=UPI0032659F02